MTVPGGVWDAVQVFLYSCCALLWALVGALLGNLFRKDTPPAEVPEPRPQKPVVGIVKIRVSRDDGDDTEGDEWKKGGQ